MSKKDGTKKTGGYGVGYGKPPAKNQFKPGKSGNPKGRPKGQPTFHELFLQEASRRVKLETPGGVQTMSKVEVVLRRLFNSANGGDLGAAKLVLSYMARMPMSAEATEPAPGAATFAIPDEEAIGRMLARFQHIAVKETEE
jgi:hypothetical protein